MIRIMICISKRLLAFIAFIIACIFGLMIMNLVNNGTVSSNLKAASKKDVWPLCPIDLKTGKTTKNCCSSSDRQRGFRCYLGKYSIDCKSSRTYQSVTSCQCDDNTGKCLSQSKGKKGSVYKLRVTPTNTPTPTPPATAKPPTLSAEEKLNKDFGDWFNKNRKTDCFKISFPCGFTIDLNKDQSLSLHRLFESSAKLREYYMAATDGPIVYNYSNPSTGIWVDFDEYKNRDFGAYPDWINSNARIAWYETSDFDGYVAPIHAWPHVVGITKNGDLFYAAKDIYWDLVSNYPFDGTPVNLNDKYMDEKALQLSPFPEDTGRHFFFFPTKSSSVILFEAYKSGNEVVFRGYFLRYFSEYAKINY